MKEKQTELSFEDYYESLKNSPIDFRDELCKEFGISIRSFYNKIKNNGEGFDNLQKKFIAQKTGIPVETLFPQPCLDH